MFLEERVFVENLIVVLLVKLLVACSCGVDGERSPRSSDEKLLMPAVCK